MLPRMLGAIRSMARGSQREAGVWTTAMPRLLRPDARVQHGVENVGGEVHEHVRHPDGEDAALDEGVVAVGDGGDGEAADAWPTKDGLGDDGAGQQSAEL